MRPELLSNRVKSLKPSPTLQLAAQARELAQQGKDVISMSVGEPDWNTYEPIKNAAIAAIQNNFTRYTEAAGILELRQKIAQVQLDELKINYSPTQVIVGTGAKFIIYLAIQCLIDSGDEVIIPAPYWVSYVSMVELAGGTARVVSCPDSQGFKITAEQLEKAITEKTKALFLCSPNNPTGLFYSESELQAITQVLKKHPQVIVISDDIYNRLVFSGKKLAPHLLHVAPELVDRILVVNGVSKTFAMTGWRIGWGLGPQVLIKSMIDLQSQSTSNTSSISQKAALAALDTDESEIQNALSVLKKRRDQAMKILNQIPLIRAHEPAGAFYIWLDIRNCFGKKYQNQPIVNSRDFAQSLLLNEFVAAVPGLEFGLEGYLRLSFALDEKRMVEALERLQRFIQNLS